MPDEGATAVEFHASEALQWYREAAAQGNVEAKHLNEILMLLGRAFISLPSHSRRGSMMESEATMVRTPQPKR